MKIKALLGMILAAAQSPRGQIPGLAGAPQDLGASDTTPLFLIGLALYRRVRNEPDFPVHVWALARKAS